MEVQYNIIGSTVMMFISDLACIEYCLQKVISVKIISQCDIKLCVQLRETILLHHEIN